MNFPKKAHIVIFLVAFILNTVTYSQNNAEPWKKLFNGKDFSGWIVSGSNGKAWIEDSAFVCHQVINTPEHTFVRTKKKFTDFILEADCMIEGELHTGFLLRCIETPDTATVSLYGYQVKIDPTSRKWTGGIFDDFGKTWSWWYTLADNEKARNAFKSGEWNHFRIEAIDNNIKVWVNDVPAANLINSKYKRGYIALKIHSMGNTPEKEKELMRYKNIKIITKNPAKYQRPMDLQAVAMD